MSTRGFENVTASDAAKMGRRQPVVTSAWAEKAKRSKYGAKKTVVDNITFDSAKEANRYGILKMLASAGKVETLEVQPVFSIDVRVPDSNALVHICDYIADFRYYLPYGGGCVIEDVKSKATATPLYKLKRKLVEALYDIEITEI